MIETNNQQLITRVMSSFTRENELLEDQIRRLIYYGRMTRDDAYALSAVERDKWSEFLNERFEEANKLMSKGISVSL